jgi:hypothetical protein
LEKSASGGRAFPVLIIPFQSGARGAADHRGQRLVDRRFKFNIRFQV